MSDISTVIDKVIDKMVRITITDNREYLGMYTLRYLNIEFR